MLTPTIPFEYARLVDTTDRLRKSRPRPAGSRVRRAAGAASKLR